VYDSSLRDLGLPQRKGWGLQWDYYGPDSIIRDLQGLEYINKISKQAKGLQGKNTFSEQTNISYWEIDYLTMAMSI
jgi:hypothetical protein